MLREAGFNVLREVPAEYWAGIASKLYSVHGGVIRDQGGRILAHLATPGMTAPLELVPGLDVISKLLQAHQLKVLNENVLRAVNWSMASTALSGLGLATSLASVIYLSQRINHIDNRIVEIKRWLKTSVEGELRAAVSNVAHAAKSQDGAQREQLLLAAKTSFTSLAHHYRSQAASAVELADLEVFEESAVTAMMGAVLCASDVGLHEPAAEDVVNYHNEWAAMARAQARRLLQLDQPARLLDGRYVAVLPTPALIGLLDFALEAEKDLEWIDELRSGYGRGTALTSGINPIDEHAIRFARRVQARHDVLSGYRSHFALLAERRISSSVFARSVQAELVGVEGLALIVNSGSAAMAEGSTP